MNDQLPTPERPKRGPKTPEGKAAALANLKSFGPDRQPTRRTTTAGESIKEWINRMAGWTEKQVRSVTKKDAAPMSQKIAAARLLSAVSDGGDFDRIMDRTTGKPLQESKVEVDTTAQVVVQRERAIVLDESEACAAEIQAFIDKRARELNPDNGVERKEPSNASA